MNVYTTANAKQAKVPVGQAKQAGVPVKQSKSTGPRVWTAEELFAALGHIKLGGTTCRYPLETCADLVPSINRINALKAEKKAVILAHSYVSPEIVTGVADYVGDSYQLSRDAMASDAEIIIFAAVRFMAETAKILNPNKKVYLPARQGGCTLADSIDGKTMRDLREKYPDHAFISYINTTAEIKALSDIIVTSSNVYDIVEYCDHDKIVFLPDRLMGENIIREMQRRRVEKDIVLYDGTCYVHEAYDRESIDFMKMEYGGDLKVVVHPECSTDVVAGADYVGSTSQMMDYVRTTPAQDFFLLTECGLVSRLESELAKTDKRCVGACTLCRYMKSNHLADIERILLKPEASDEVDVDAETQIQARKSIDQMFAHVEKAKNSRASQTASLS